MYEHATRPQSPPQTGSTLDVQGRSFDVEALRAQFPALHQQVHGKPLVYLDNSATTHKPRVVLEAIDDYYRLHNSNVHRGVHTLSQRATERFEGVRERVRAFLNAADTREIIFTRGTTEAINLVASSWGGAHLQPGDEVLITWMEHHSNIVPWQMACQRTGATLKVVPIDDRGVLDLDAFAALLNERTRLVGVVHVSNALGTINPVAEIVAQAHEVGAVVLLDGAQAVPHLAVDVAALGVDFYAFSGHKIYGPTGIGVLYGRAELLQAMPPYQGGGDMIRSVSFEKTLYAGLPSKFEAGTPNIAGAIGLGAALDFVDSVGLDAIAAHEGALTRYGTERLLELPGVRLIGTAPHKAAVLSFVMDKIHPHDIGTIVDMSGVAIRTGHHCAQPVMDRFGVPATARASLALYNTEADVDALIEALQRVIEMFA